MRRNYGHLNLLALEKCLSDLVVEEEEQQEEEEEKLSSMDHLCHTSTQCTFEIEEKEEENTYGFLDDILQNEFDTSKPVFIMNNLKERTEEVVDQNCRTSSSSFSFSCSSSVGSSSLMSRLSISLRDEEDFLNSIETCKRLYSTSTSSCSSSSLLLSKNTTAEATRTTPAIPAFMAQHQKELQALRYYTMQMMFASTQYNGTSKMKAKELDDIFFFEPEHRRPLSSVSSASSSTVSPPGAAPWRNIIQTV